MLLWAYFEGLSLLANSSDIGWVLDYAFAFVGLYLLAYGLWMLTGSGRAVLSKS
jgi:hypothetical protein